MKFSVGLLAVASLLALTSQKAEAQVAQGWEIGVQGYGYRYKEAIEDIRVEDEGRFFGFGLEYGRTFANDCTFNARLWGATGSVDYSANDGNQLDDVEQSVGQAEFLVGRNFAASKAISIRPYLGLGGRSLEDLSGGRVTEAGAFGYDREIGYAYVPLGVAAMADRPGGGRLAVYGQYNRLVGGTSRSEFGDVDPSAPTVEVEFEDGHGWEFGAKLTTPVGRGTIGVQPFVRTWNVDRSTSAFFEDEELSVELFEPPSETRELGVRLVYGF